jgi:hypothetical protein
MPHTSSADSSVGFGASRNCTHLLPYPHSPRCRSFHGTFCRFARHQYDPHDSDRHRVCSDRDCANSYCGHKKTSHTCRYHRISSGHNKAFWLISRFSHTDHNEAWIPFCVSFLPLRTFTLLSLLLSHRVARRLSPSGESFTRGFSHVSLVFDEEINRKRGLLIPSIVPHSLFSFVSLHEGAANR